MYVDNIENLSDIKVINFNKPKNLQINIYLKLKLKIIKDLFQIHSKKRFYRW